MEKQEQIESIIYKFLAESASEDENEQLTEWLAESNENRLYYFTIKRIWLEGKEIPDMNKMTDASWDRFKLRTSLQSISKIKDDYRSHINFRKISIAATILVLIGLSSFLGIKLKILSEYQKTTHEITVPLGSRSNIILPDGTDVWLNAGSNLTYSSDFGRKNRSVSLTGEGFFNVNPDKKSDFTVVTRDLNIRVLGTKFNVKSYPEEIVTETTLVSGKVEVLLKADLETRAMPLLLSPNQRMTYSRDVRELKVHEYDHSKQNEEIVVEEVIDEPVRPSILVSNISDTEEYTSWKDGRLTFRGESLETLTPKLERFFNVNILYSDKSIKTIQYTGTLEEVTIEEVLRAIASTSGIKYEINKNQVIISK